MSSREMILQVVLHNQPETTPLPDISTFGVEFENLAQSYIDVFKSINGEPCLVSNTGEIKEHLLRHFDMQKRVVTTLAEFNDIAEQYSPEADPHTFEDVELAVIKSNLAVAENGAIWLTEDAMGQRIIPYICQHLAVLVNESDIVASMHDAYARIGIGDYGFGGFIGGPSKTADIEQALVLGAHGPLTMSVFIIRS